MTARLREAWWWATTIGGHAFAWFMGVWWLLGFPGADRVVGYMLSPFFDAPVHCGILGSDVAFRCCGMARGREVDANNDGFADDCDDPAPLDGP